MIAAHTAEAELGTLIACDCGDEIPETGEPVAWSEIGVGAQRLIGGAVVDRVGDRLGEVHDLLLTEDGFALTEIDSVPGGIGLTAFLNELYAGGGDGSVVGAGGRMVEAFYGALAALAASPGPTAAFATFGAFTALGGIEAMQTDDPEVMIAVMSSPSFYLAMLVGIALMIPLMMTFWFAPSLVALNDIPALTAMKLSFLGCIKNILPFLLYGLIAFVLMLIAVIPFGLGLLILSPVLIASIYAGYRDIYFG